MLKYLTDIIDLFFPKVCLACHEALSDHELHLCTNCRHDLPVLNHPHDSENEVTKIFYGRIPIKHATSLLLFEKKGLTQQLIHNLKYKNQEQVSYMLGSWLGAELKEHETYRAIDMVIPVPLHKNKLKKRGYNQVAGFAKELASELDAEYMDEILIKVTNTQSQVGKNRWARWNNTEIFKLQNHEKIANKHLLLVDDVITTGATMEACFNVLTQAKNVKISLASMAIAQ